ncbi:MAG: c-type cytochrome [Lentisphaeraceae bacterium]|nr:c-type cytochrome [Lentisphaeraceae bacterium]
MFKIVLSLFSLVTFLAAEPNRGGTIDRSTYDLEEAKSRFKVPEGFEIQLAASSNELGIANPLAINFDNKGRLWVLCWPDYPQLKAGKSTRDKLFILEDVDGDGKMDKKTLFAGDLHAATGFEFGDGGVYIAEPPFLTFLKDTDGDDKADTRQKVLHGFGTEDSHHTISAFTWGADGGLYFGEGNFHHSRIETPHGPVKVNNGAFYRYDPRSGKLEDIVNYGCWNPWGQAFDKWGQHFIADASPGNNYYATVLSGKVNFPAKHSRTKVYTSRVRPTAGNEIITSRHFPDEMQGDYIIANCIGFHGIKRHRFKDEGAGFTTEEMPDLLNSTDPNFRPVDLKFAPDGSLYICDWFNPLIGHMQYAFSDKRRDNENGRIWRLVYKKKALVDKPVVAKASVEQLLESLKLYEDKARYNARRELRERPLEEVAGKLQEWISDLDTSHQDYELHRLEALWLKQSLKLVDTQLLKDVLNSKDYRARAAAARVIRYWKSGLPDYMQVHEKLINNKHARVRMQAVVNLSYETTNEALELTLKTPVDKDDYYLNYAIQETLLTLEPIWERYLGTKSSQETVESRLFASLSPEALLDRKRDLRTLKRILLRSDMPTKERYSALQELAVSKKVAAHEELQSLLSGLSGNEIASLLPSLPQELLMKSQEFLRTKAKGDSSQYFIAALIKINDFAFVENLEVSKVLTALSVVEKFDAFKHSGIFSKAFKSKSVNKAELLTLLDEAGELPLDVVVKLTKELSSGQNKFVAAKILQKQKLSLLTSAQLKPVVLKLTDELSKASLEEQEKREFNELFYLAKSAVKVSKDSSKDALNSVISKVSKNIIEDVNQQKYKWGKYVYQRACYKCHQKDGQGLSGAFPPLVGSEWLKRSDEDLIKIVMHGMMGPVTVKGKKYNSVMAPVGNMLKDGEIAAAITYVKNTWGNRGRDVSSKKVTEIRQKYGQRGLWTVEELDKSK